MSLFDFFMIGVLGGVSPGPITALMLGETFQRGFKRGIQVPLALIVSNIFFALLSVTLLSFSFQFSQKAEQFLGIIGGLLLIFMAVQEWRAQAHLELKTASKPFLKALLIESLNPHPYLFWFTILAPTLTGLIQKSLFADATLHFISFVIGIVGTKSLIVIVAHQIKPWLTDRHLRIVLKVLALFLALFGLKLIINSL